MSVNYVDTSITAGLDPFADELRRPAFYAKPPFQVGTSHYRLFFADQNISFSITEIARLRANWDGYGAESISEQTIEHCQRALGDFVAYLPVPDITPNTNGTVSLEWESENGLANMEIGISRYSLFVSPLFGDSLHFEGEANNISNYHAQAIHGVLYPVDHRSTVSGVLSDFIDDDFESANA